MTDTAGVPTPQDIIDNANSAGDTGDITAPPTELEELTARQRTQRRLVQARTTAQATVREPDPRPRCRRGGTNQPSAAVTRPALLLLTGHRLTACTSSAPPPRRPCWRV